MASLKEKWVTGDGVGLSTWTTIMSTDLNSLASGDARLQAADIANDTALDMFMDLSLKLASAAFTGSPFIGIFLYPLNDDATTYGDGRFTSSAAMASSNAPLPYWKGNIQLVAATQAQTGTLTGIIIPPGKFRLVLWNSGGVNLASSGNTLKYKTYDRSVG